MAATRTVIGERGPGADRAVHASRAPPSRCGRRRGGASAVTGSPSSARSVLAVMVAAVVVGPFVYRVPINEIDFKAKLKGPSWAHPLGTDDLGQDLLARMLYGGRISLAVGVAAMLIAISVGHRRRRGRGPRRAARWTTR